MRISDWSSDVCSSDLWEVSADGKTYTMTLRPGLKWHDGKPVKAEDCVASIKRWAAGDGMGRTLLKRSEERRVGKECAVRVDLGGRRIIKKKKKQINVHNYAVKQLNQQQNTQLI